jgi:hypothetical protein
MVRERFTMVGAKFRETGRGSRGRLFVRTASVLVVAVLCLRFSAARGGDDPLAISASLGLGMHAYHAGDYQRSYDDMSAVIEAGSRDPRAYYFRGLAALKLGRTDEAEADFTAGAARESVGRGSWPVSRSLERVQGCDRLALERHRSRARLVALQREREAEASRYAPDSDAADVLRRRRPESIPPSVRGSRVEAEDAAEPVEELPAAKAAAEPDAKAPDTSDPFGDEPAAEDQPPAGDSEREDEPVEREAAAIDGSADEKDQQAEAAAVEAEATADQEDQRAERLGAEAEDAAAQQDEREEMDADAGEKAAEEVKDDTTSLGPRPARAVQA